MKTMLDYINQIPEYIENHSDGDFDLLRKDYDLENKKSLTIVASGSSNNASFCAFHYLKKYLHTNINIYTPYTFINYEQLDKDSFYIVISQSGRSINTLEVIDRLRKENIVTHFITDNKEISEDDLLKIYHLEVGNEEVPFVTLGMASTIYFLMKFANKQFTDIELFKTLFKQYQQKAEAYFESNKQMLMNIKRVHILGSGPTMYVAREGALKFCETLQVAASHYEIEEYLHGGNFETQKDHLVIAIDSNDADVKRIEQLKNNLHVICDNYYALDRCPLDENLSIFIYLVFFQTLVYLISREKGNTVPTMKDEYLEFEGLMKAKTINFYD